MAKLTLLALAFAAIVAFSEVSAYTITTTTIEDDDFSNTRGSQSYQQCRRQIPIQEVNHCEMHLTQGTSQIRMPVESEQMPHLQLCCNQLKNIEQECQCEAIQQVFQQAQQQQQQQKQGGRQGRQQGGQQQMQQMLRKAQQLPNDCNLQVQQCPIRSPRV